MAAGPQPCPTSALALSLGRSDNGMSQYRYPLVAQNLGPTTCTLRGYPGVSYVTGASGTQVGAPAARSASPVDTVTLAPRQSASATLDVVQPLAFDPTSCRITAVRGFRVYPPGQTTAGFVSRPAQACSVTSLPGNSLTVTAFTAG